MIDEAIHNVLITDSVVNGFVADRVDPVYPSEQYPCLSYWQTNGDFERKLSGSARPDLAYYQIDVWALRRTDVRQLAERVVDLFRGITGKMGSTDFVTKGTSVENLFDVPEDIKDSSGNKIFHMGVEIHVSYDPQQ